MKKMLSILLTFAFVFVSMTGCSAAEPEKSSQFTLTMQIGNPVMTVNGVDMPIDEQGTVPVIVNDRTLLPVRAVIEQMGGTVGWNGETEEVTLTYGEDEIKLTIGSTEALLNGETRTLDVAPAVMNDRTMLPIRFIAESFRFNVEWNESEQRVTISNSKNSEQKPETPDEGKLPEKSEESEETQTPAGKSLVVYFSATGNTKALAEKIAEESGSDLFEIVPEEPYTSADLNYSNSDCRANKEQNDADARPAISNTIENIGDYDTIFIGYPIWWGTMPKIINTFLDTYDLSGKTIMPFCTSGSSGISSSISAIKSTCPDAEVKTGFRGTSGTSSTQIQDWFNENGFEKTAEGSPSAVLRKIRLVWDNNEVVIALENHKTTEDFISKLPMTVTIEDYNNTEKISRFSDEIYKDTTAAGLKPSVGDVALYAPWGNLAIFYKEWSYSEDLIPIGHIESGLDALTGMNDDFEVTIELVI